MTFSKDARWFVSGSNDRTLRIWDHDATTPRRTTLGHEGRVSCVTLSSDGRTIISGDDRGYVHFSHVATGRNMFRIRLNELGVNDIACSPDGKRLAIAHTNQLHLFTLDHTPEFSSRHPQTPPRASTQTSAID